MVIYRLPPNSQMIENISVYMSTAGNHVIRNVCKMCKSKTNIRHFLRVEGKKVQVGKDQEKAQSERDSHPKNRGGKKQINNQALIP